MKGNSSFEENLQNEFSSASNVSQSEEQIRKLNESRSQNQKDHSESSSEHLASEQQSSSFNWDVNAEVSGGFIFASAKLSTHLGGSQSKASQQSQSQKSAQSRNAESALAVSMAQDNHQMSKKSRDIASKNAQTAIRKVATETSQNNKVEISSSSTMNQEETQSRKEFAMLENQNPAKTINYNFYQLRNIYSNKIYLKDVKIVVNTGFELVEGTGISSIRVYELEEFNKIFHKMDDSDLSVIICARIARKVLKHHTDLLSDNPENNLYLKLSDKDWSKEKLLKVHTIYKHLSPILESKKMVKEDTSEKMSKKEALEEDTKSDVQTSIGNKLREMRWALAELKKLTFEFNENEEATLITKSEHTVNSDACWAEPLLSTNSAIDPYYEARRKQELQYKDHLIKKQETEIKQQEAVTQNIEMATKNKKQHLLTSYPSNIYRTGNSSLIFSSREDRTNVSTSTQNLDADFQQFNSQF